MTQPRTGDPGALAAEERRFAEAVLRAEAEAVRGLRETVAGEPFARAVELVEACAEAGGTLLVTGLGKSGHIGAKISATMASLGIPSHLVHPAEAAHGDLGRFRTRDLVLALSFSGETDEVVNLCSILRQDEVRILGITRRRDGAPSSLERLADVTLHLDCDDETAGMDFGAPTCSTTAMLALGDALAMTTARRRGFTDHDFAARHPGGALGGQLRPVTDVLRFRAGDNLTPVLETATVAEALARAQGEGRRPGAIVLVDGAGRLSGIFTDGDLRRLVIRDARELERPISEVMTASPRKLPASARVRDAVRMFREHRQDEIPVVDEEGRPVGILDVQDLIAMRLVRD